jgi:hypothetical protein
MKSIISDIPVTPQDWNRNPKGYIKHQRLLIRLVTYLESMGIECVLPEDKGEWDRGIDLIVNGSRWDLKGFGLDFYGNTHTWRSSYHRGRPAPLYDGTETDWFVHGTDGPVSEWMCGRRRGLRTSKFNFAPYYFTQDCVTVAELVQDVFTSAA